MKHREWTRRIEEVMAERSLSRDQAQQVVAKQEGDETRAWHRRFERAKVDGMSSREARIHADKGEQRVAAEADRPPSPPSAASGAVPPSGGRPPASVKRSDPAPPAAERPTRGREGETMHKFLMIVRAEYTANALTAARQARTKASVRAAPGGGMEVTVSAWAENAMKKALPPHAVLGTRRIEEDTPREAIENARNSVGLS